MRSKRFETRCLLYEMSTVSILTRNVPVDLNEQIEQLDYIDWCVNSSNPSLFSQGALESIEARIRAAWEVSRQSTLAASENVNQSDVESYQANVSSHLIAAIEQLPHPRLRSFSRNEADDKIEEIVSRAKDAIEGVFRSASSANSALKSELGDLGLKLGSERELDISDCNYQEFAAASS